MEILWKDTVNSAFPQYFHARKSGEITVFYAVSFGGNSVIFISYVLNAILLFIVLNMFLLSHKNMLSR